MQMLQLELSSHNRIIPCMTSEDLIDCVLRDCLTNSFKCVIFNSTFCCILYHTHDSLCHCLIYSIGFSVTLLG